MTAEGEKLYERIAVDQTRAMVTQFGFDDVVVDVATYEITADGRPVSVEPQVFDVLRYLLEHRHRVVSKEELLDNVWGDRFVGESALTTRIKSLRKALGDDGRRQAVIRTVHRRGYQFVAEITSGDGSADGVDIDGLAGPNGATAGPSAGNGHTAVDEPLPLPAVIGGPGKPTRGRTHLVTEIEKRLTTGALVTLVGPAGVGKTHLARYIGAEQSHRFGDGSWFVPLTAVRDGDAVPQAVLDAMGRNRLPDVSPAETVQAALAGAEALLVIDNCEHVLAPAAELVADLRRAGGSVTVLATSRQRLGVPGEQVINVPVLAPEAAGELLADLSHHQGAEIDPSSDDAAALCRRLDCLPLALELAVAQVRVLGLEAVMGLLDERLALLADASAGDDHHRTLVGAIESSVRMLDSDVATTLARFALFAGSFELEAAVSVAQAGTEVGPVDAVRHLVELAERSLVVVELTDDRRRYRLLESVRLYAARLLADPTAAKAAHLGHYVEAAERRSDRLAGIDFESAFTEVAGEWSNYRVAIDYAVELGRPEAAARLLAATLSYAEVTQRLEHVDWAERLLALADADQAWAAEIRAGLSRLLVLQDRARATELADDSGDPATSVASALSRSWCAYLNGDFDAGDRYLAAAEHLVSGTKGLDEIYTAAFAVFQLARSNRDPSPAGDRVLALAGTGPLGTAYRTWAEASMALHRGDLADAIERCDRLIDVADDHGFEQLVLVGYRVRTVALATHPDLDLVARRIRRAMARYERTRRWISAGSDSPIVARVLHERGRSEEALVLLRSHRPFGPVGGWSTMFGAQLSERIDAEAPEAAAGAAEIDPLGPRELCHYALVQLDEIIDGGGEA